MIKKNFILAFFFLSIFTVVTSAQRTLEQSIIDAKDQFSDIKNRSMEMERIKRESYKRSVNAGFTPDFSAIKEDFEQMQKLNSNVFVFAPVDVTVNYEDVLKYVSEIHHRAVRLNSNLFFVEKKSMKDLGKDKKRSEPQDIKTLLNVMDESVNNFVHNSIFQNIKVVNSDDSLKAQKDLEKIIEVSLKVKIGSKKLSNK